MFLVRTYLLIAPNILLAICLIEILRRKIQEHYPILTAYFAVCLLQFLVSFTLNLLYFSPHRSPSFVAIYQWVTVISTGVVSLFEIAVLYELANDLVLRRSRLAASLRPVLRWAAALLLLTAFGVSALFSQPGTRRVMAAFETLDFSSNLIKVGLLLVLVLFTRALQISWRSLPAGIALGFSVTGAAEILAAVLLAKLGHSYYRRVDLFRMAAFHISVLIWLVYIFAPAMGPNVAERPLERTDLEAWNQEMQKILR